jgi:hypothetical protein
LALFARRQSTGQDHDERGDERRRRASRPIPAVLQQSAKILPRRIGDERVEMMAYWADRLDEFGGAELSCPWELKKRALYSRQLAGPPLIFPKSARQRTANSAERNIAYRYSRWS